MSKQKKINLESKSENQTNLIRSIYDNDVIICTGPSGTGKSMISCGIASKMLQTGEIERVIVTRPLICTGKDIGALPGTLDEKIMPYLRVCEEYFKLFLTPAVTARYVENESIRFLPLELMRGSTFNHSLMILDEAQNCTVEQIKMFITRMGIGSKVIVNGDVRQVDLRDSGLEYVKNKLQNIEKVAISELTNQDIQRNGVIGKILLAFET